MGEIERVNSVMKAGLDARLSNRIVPGRGRQNPKHRQPDEDVLELENNDSDTIEEEIADKPEPASGLDLSA